MSNPLQRLPHRIRAAWQHQPPDKGPSNLADSRYFPACIRLLSIFASHPTHDRVTPLAGRLAAGGEQEQLWYALTDPDSAFPQVMNLMTLREFQQLIRTMYHDKDAARGVEGTFMWLTEEIGELATALRSGTPEEQALEFADVLAWLATIANVANIDLDAAIATKYGGGCPGCGEVACTCPDAEKP